MPIATIALDFDPFLHLGDRVVRWETLALAATVFFVAILAAIQAGRTPARDAVGASRLGRRIPSQREAWGPDIDEEPWHLRRDDLLFILLGVVPGAVIGGRLGYVLLHLDYYSTRLDSAFDPGQGSMQLGMAVVLGTVTGTYVIRLLEAPVGRWLHTAAAPLLLGIALGKLSMVLGGDGQGAPATVDWATAYVGAGPWGSLDPSRPAHPAQVYEALATIGALALILVLGRFRVFRRRDGRSFFVGLGLWAAGRFAVAFTWRDPDVVGPLGADQLISAGIALASLILIAVRTWQVSRPPRSAVPEVRWPDADARRLF